jgi:hypothetical protein
VLWFYKLVTANFSRSERILETAVARGAITENGKAALIAALDPFHDEQIQHLRGWPDLETQPSIVRTIRQSTTIKALAAGDNIMIYTWPILNKAMTRKSTRRNAVIDSMVNSATSNYEIGPVTAQHFSDLDHMTLTAGTNGWTSFLESDYLLDSNRLIGMGVEVYDVTADIYKQGTCTCFQVPQSTVEPETCIVVEVVDDLRNEPRADGAQKPKGVERRVGLTTLPTPVDLIYLKKYPSSLNTIMQTPGVRQWDAKQGAYTVIPFHSRDNFPGQPIYCTPAVYDDSLLIAHEEVDFLNIAPVNIGPYAEPLTDGGFVVFLANKFAPVHSKGILLSGLNENSTFTINVVYYLESFPAVDNIALVSLARPSAALDEVALEMISVATQQLPIAVPVAMNGLGDWFAEAVSEIAPYVSAIGRGFGLTPLSAIADSAGKYAGDYMKGPSYKNTGGFFAPSPAQSNQAKPPRAKPKVPAPPPPPKKPQPNQQKKKGERKLSRKEKEQVKQVMNTYFGK